MIYLPIAVDAFESEGIVDDVHFQGKGCILVLDDEKDVAVATQRSLESLGYTVMVCFQPSKALALLEKSPNVIDLLVTDYAMPKMTGLEVASQIHIIRPELPIILCTGYGENLSRETIEEAGIRGFLVKPVLRRTLGKTIEALLNPVRTLENIK